MPVELEAFWCVDSSKIYQLASCATFNLRKFFRYLIVLLSRVIVVGVRESICGEWLIFCLLCVYFRMFEKNLD